MVQVHPMVSLVAVVVPPHYFDSRVSGGVTYFFPFRLFYPFPFLPPFLLPHHCLHLQLPLWEGKVQVSLFHQYLVIQLLSFWCLVQPFQALWLPAEVHHHSQELLPPLHIYQRHRITARREHTPAAHGQSSSPSLLSLACSLQQK
ncbi:hypothetical protein TcCL_Unassigned03789 [Trypanosoma cruzi]|nr:hypothetical protein TcCL_Unassigned03789 [Trypanosoma cruzi]